MRRPRRDWRRAIARVAPPERPRWRCGEPDCPKRRWQTIQTLGEVDELDVVLGEYEAHWQTVHQDKEAA